MYYVLFGGKRTKENLSIVDKLSEEWVTLDEDPVNLVKALHNLNQYNQKSYNLVLLDPYIEMKYHRAGLILKVLRLNNGKRATAIITDSHLESVVSLYRHNFKFHELQRDDDIAQKILEIVSLN